MGRPASLPHDVRIYTVGDIHGRTDLLQAIEEAIIADAAQAPSRLRLFLIYLGDYVDRGGDSQGVIQHFLEPPPARFERILLLGNHDLWMRDFLDGPAVGPAWLQHGGEATLQSYGVAIDKSLPDGQRIAEAQARFVEAVNEDHKQFLRELDLAFDLGDYFFCHAGIRPSRPLAQQTPADLLWMREPFLSWNGSASKVIVHGHTITAQPVIKRNRIGIDTGAYLSEILTCLVLEGTDMRFITTSP